jgi:hypothetical protein
MWWSARQFSLSRENRSVINFESKYTHLLPQQKINKLIPAYQHQCREVHQQTRSKIQCKYRSAVCRRVLLITILLLDEACPKISVQNHKLYYIYCVYARYNLGCIHTLRSISKCGRQVERAEEKKAKSNEININFWLESMIEKAIF